MSTKPFWKIHYLAHYYDKGKMCKKIMIDIVQASDEYTARQWISEHYEKTINVQSKTFKAVGIEITRITNITSEFQ